MHKMKYGFDDFIDWQKSFHVMKPIKDEAFLSGLVTRLRNGCSGSAGNGVVINEELLGSGTPCKSCTCLSYRCAAHPPTSEPVTTLVPLAPSLPLWQAAWSCARLTGITRGASTCAWTRWIPA